MKAIAIFVSLLFLDSCATQPSFEKFVGGNRLSQPGVSFVPPTTKVWQILVFYTYQTTLAMYGDDPNESFIAQVSIFNIPSQGSDKTFLSLIQDKSAEEPKTGRFEMIEESLVPYEERKEECIKKRTSAKDYGAKRGGTYTIFETYGMYCVHPKKPSIGVFVELSRKAPFGRINSEFETLGEQLLQSVVFSDFRV